AMASAVATDVHRKFANTAITSPRPVRSSASPADDFSINLRNYGGIKTGNGLKPRLLFFCRARLRFLRPHSVLHAPRIKLTDGPGILEGRVPNVYAIRLYTFVRAITRVPLRLLLHLSLARMPVVPRATPASRT